MARWENEDVSGLDLPEPNKVATTFIGKNGKLCDESVAYAVLRACANSETYYVRFSRGELIDPHSVDGNAKLRNKPNFKKVKKKCFEEYVKYLKSKNTLYFTRSRRMAMEI